MAMRAAEFFAGMGLIRAGLERCGVQTVFANDIDQTKAALYRENWGCDELRLADIRELSGLEVPDVDIATASFPCIDTSVAGWRQGLEGQHSSLVFEFLRIISEMGERSPKAILLENVPGFLTADDGAGFQRVNARLRDLDYHSRYICVDAAAFVPQSRPRVFVLARQRDGLDPPEPPCRRTDLRLFDVANRRGAWWGVEQKQGFLDSLSPIQNKKLAKYIANRRISYLGAYRRTRNGRPVWEIRSDEIAGALRTTGGGSSRQAIVRVGRGKVDVRWMGLCEYARLQGADDLRYKSVSERQAMFALGDAVCVPVIEWIGHNWLCPAVNKPH